MFMYKDTNLRRVILSSFVGCKGVRHWKGGCHLILSEGVLHALVTTLLVSFKAVHQTMLNQNYLKSREECVRFKKSFHSPNVQYPNLKPIKVVSNLKVRGRVQTLNIPITTFQ